MSKNNVFVNGYNVTHVRLSKFKISELLHDTV
jgi:hypothetical protein